MKMAKVKYLPVTTAHSRREGKTLNIYLHLCWKSAILCSILSFLGVSCFIISRQVA